MKSISILQKHQMWRKGGAGPSIDPKLISSAIDEAIEIMKDFDRANAEIKILEDDVRKFIGKSCAIKANLNIAIYGLKEALSTLSNTDDPRLKVTKSKIRINKTLNELEGK